MSDHECRFCGDKANTRLRWSWTYRGRLLLPWTWVCERHFIEIELLHSWLCAIGILDGLPTREVRW